MRALTLQNGHRPAAAQCSVPAGSLGLSKRPSPSSSGAFGSQQSRALHEFNVVEIHESASRV
jgi:hypothetical protein